MLSRWIALHEFAFYIIIGTIATAIDWGTFSLCFLKFQWYYQIALVSGYTLAAIFHYIANKIVTFKCTSKELQKQLPLYISVAAVSLVMNMLVMALLVRFIPFPKVILRMATTIIMILPNYLLHKHITFSKKIFSTRLV